MSRRIPELDSLRGLAAVAVVLFHLRFARYQILGSSVDLFFVLSGYLITRIIVEESSRPNFFRTFYLRRSLRIFPVYYLAFALVVLTNRWRFAPDPLEGLWRYATYTQFFEGYWSEPNDRFSRWFYHSWTLALEEQFYLVWPLIVVTIGRTGVLKIALPLLALAGGLRAYGVYPHLLLTRCDGMVLGAALAALFVNKTWMERHGTRLRSACVALLVFGVSARFGLGLAIGPVLKAYAGTWWPRVVSASIVTAQCVGYTGLIGLVVGATGSRWLAPLRDPRLCALGTISYGIYVYHPVVMGLVLNVHTQVLGGKASWRLDIVRFVLAIVAAAVSWRFFEEPILRLKDRFRYEEKAAPSATVPAPHFEPAILSESSPVATEDTVAKHHS